MYLGLSPMSKGKCDWSVGSRTVTAVPDKGQRWLLSIGGV